MENETNKELIKEVNSVSYAALMHAKELVKNGARIMDVAKSIEEFIKEKGYGFAFPVNISLDTEAAHDTPEIDDARIFNGNIVKIDLGAEKEGMLGDCALTIDLSGSNGNLLDASQDALKNAIASIKAGVKAREVGKVIEETIKKAGFSPIYNLGGHQIKKNELHAGLFLPNYDNGDETVLEEGMVIAIEPFATNGKGRITEGDYCQIYSFLNERKVRSATGRAVMKKIKENYPSNPFAARWLEDMAGKFDIQVSLQELYVAGAIERYPVLVEVSKGLVAQFEASVMVEKDGCTVLTK
ncbi:MAG: type II methionyl aminopeptidase [Candidatus Micrarchaeaceae archaeon]